MDVEELTDFIINTTNFSNVLSDSPEADAALLVHEILYFIISLLATAADLIIIYVLTRYKNMRKPVNMYILHWIVSDAVNILVEPYAYRILAAVERSIISGQFVCMFISATSILRTVATAFMLILVLQWFFVNSQHDFFDKYYRWIIAGVWIVIGATQLVIVSTYCIAYDHYIILHDILYFFGILALVILVAITNCLRRCANPFTTTSSITVALATAYILCWLPVMASYSYHMFADYSHVSVIVESIGFCIGNAFPLVMFYLFWRLDRNFHTCVLRVFRRTRGHDDGTTCFEEMDEEPVDERPRNGGALATVAAAAASQQNGSVGGGVVGSGGAPTKH